MYNEQSLLKELEKMGIRYEYISHPPVFTSEQANAAMPQMTGAHCKNLFVKDRTGQKWLLTIPDDRKADLKQVAEKIGSKRLSFCDSDELMECLVVTPGSVTPLAIINDRHHRVTMIMDQTIIDWGMVRCHPMINTATISMTVDDFKKFITSMGHDLRIIKLV